MREYERAVFFRWGRLLDPPRGPGLVWKIPIVDQIVKVDLRTITLNIPPQEVITKDNVPVRVTAVAYFKIVDPKSAIVQVENYMVATSQIAQTTLRSVLGQHMLDELLSEREKINEILQGIIDEATGPWGIKVTIVEVKDVEIPSGMQRAMARQAEAERERRAKIINAEGEFQAAEKLKDAALVIEDHPIALQLRYLQTMLEVSSGSTSTIIFPAPVDLIKPFLERQKSEGPSSPGSSFSDPIRGVKSGWCPSRSRRIASISSACAPSMSSAIVSPTIAASAGSTSRRSSTARKIEACGFVRPWWKELIPASTSRPWWRANSRTSRAEFETRPMRRPAARSDASTPATSS
jgi:regulator of protease activity HflC (stomatin/prohibitin superfamily)